MTTRYVTVSEIQDFLNCKWRWYAKWVLNRIPRRWSEALEFGTAYHNVMERHFNGASLRESLLEEQHNVSTLSLLYSDQPDYAYVMMKVEKLLEKYAPQILAYVDRYSVRTLEVESTIEHPLFEIDDILWRFRGRPDRVVELGGRVYHMQHKTVAGNKDVSLFTAVLSRSLHEGMYGHHLDKKYRDMPYGGTILNILRKAPVGPRHPLEGLTHQAIVTVNEEARSRAFLKVKAAARDMYEACAVAEQYGHGALIDNTYHDDGFFHNSLDGYFDVLRGRASLDDNGLFMAREETY